MSRFALDRRTFLRGLGGIAVALPALQIMHPSKVANGAPVGPRPKRFVISYGGCSIGTRTNLVVPVAVGSAYEMTRGLKAIADLGIRDDVSIVSGLEIPWSTGTATPPPGGRSAPFHYNTVGPQFSGVRGPTSRDGAPKGPTADQIVAKAIAGDTQHPLLAYRVQPASYVGGNQISGNSGALSWRATSTGGVARVDPTVSPRLAYESLFTDPAIGSANAEEAARAQMYLRQRKSVLDLVAGDAARLTAKLGADDRIRIEQHFAEIRALETRLDAVVPTTASCKVPANPGTDPTVGGSIIEYNGAGQGYSTTNGYSNEDLRADLLTDFIAMAFACDLSRVSSFMITEWKCYMNAFPYGGWKSDMHELTHGAGPIESVADSVNWHVKQFGKLVQKVKGINDVDGTSLLDHTAMVLLFEGGHGYDPEGNNTGSAHSTENMIAIVAGRASGLRAGQHIRATKKHPAQVVASAMNAVGVAGGLGEVSGNIPELFA
jgi:hypothetical protein